MAVAKASICPVLGAVTSDFSNPNNGFPFQIREYQASFSSYRYLWTDNRYKRKVNVKRTNFDHKHNGHISQIGIHEAVSALRPCSEHRGS